MQLADRNLSLALGEGCSREQRAEILKKLLSLMGEAVIESVVFTREDLENNIHVTGMEHLHQALARKRGAVPLGPAPFSPAATLSFRKSRSAMSRFS